MVSYIRRFKINWRNLVFWAVFLTLAFSLVFVLIMLIRAPDERKQFSLKPDKSDYGLMLLQCLLGLAAMFLPALLEHRIKVVIPSRMLIAYVFFCMEPYTWGKCVIFITDTPLG